MWLQKKDAEACWCLRAQSERQGMGSGQVARLSGGLGSRFPEAPRIRYLQELWSQIPLRVCMVFGTQDLKHWILGPSVLYLNYRNTTRLLGANRHASRRCLFVLCVLLLLLLGIMFLRIIRIVLLIDIILVRFFLLLFLFFFFFVFCCSCFCLWGCGCVDYTPSQNFFVRMKFCSFQDRLGLLGSPPRLQNNLLMAYGLHVRNGQSREGRVQAIGWRSFGLLSPAPCKRAPTSPNLTERILQQPPH